jgi:hypothetical protein
MAAKFTISVSSAMRTKTRGSAMAVNGTGRTVEIRSQGGASYERLYLAFSPLFHKPHLLPV